MLWKKYENCYAVLWTMDYIGATVNCFKVLLFIEAEVSHGKSRAIAQADLVMWDLWWDKVALGQVFS
jgi:hypothetical protein